MKHQHPSTTAEVMALIRAADTYGSPTSSILNDLYAKWFLDYRYRLLLNLCAVPGFTSLLRAYSDRYYPGLNGYVLARHRQMDDWILQGLKQPSSNGAT